MTIFDRGSGKVIATGRPGISFLRSIGIAIVGFILLILFFSAVAGGWRGARRSAHTIRQSQVTAELNRRGMTVENVLLRDINLPATLKASIEAKQQAEQEAPVVSFRPQKETPEAQGKRVEAAGGRDFQPIVPQGITPSRL